MNYSRLRDLNHERKALESQISMSRNELEQVRSVQKQKMETMERGLPNGKDAVKAMRWLQDNRGKFTLSLCDLRWLCSRRLGLGLLVIALTKETYFKINSA